MKKRMLIKRLIAMMLVLAMVLALGACTSELRETESTTRTTTRATTLTTTQSGGGEVVPDTPETGKLVKADSMSDPKLRYVMIYNPKVYDENRPVTGKLMVGNLGNQVDTSMNRGDGLEGEEPLYTSISQLEWGKYFPNGIELDGDRAEPMGIDYERGDVKEFYYSSTGDDIFSRQKRIFTCVYAGEHCYIWTLGDVNQSLINSLGVEFDTKIYGGVTETFGMPRFVGETGKVNILLYGMSGGIAGYFAPPDLFTEPELGVVGLEGKTVNTGHAIININAEILQNSNYIEHAYSTIAHEFQHLVNFSSALKTRGVISMNTWLDEAMSGYIETVLYANAKELDGHYIAYNTSGLIRNGQSIYNFDTGYYDIGVYGSVYYFSQYLTRIAGKGIFSDIMDYWRTSYSTTLCTSEALTETVSDSVYEKIDNSIDYSPLNLTFENNTDEWMSKLTLNFYLSTLSNDSNISEFNKIDHEGLLYDSIGSAFIEGGGRIIIALSGDTFEIPNYSDKGLIYVGLDANFNPITNFIYQ